MITLAMKILVSFASTYICEMRFYSCISTKVTYHDKYKKSAVGIMPFKMQNSTTFTIFYQIRFKK